MLIIYLRQTHGRSQIFCKSCQNQKGSPIRRRKTPNIVKKAPKLEKKAPNIEKMINRKEKKGPPHGDFFKFQGGEGGGGEEASAYSCPLCMSVQLSFSVIVQLRSMICRNMCKERENSGIMSHMRDYLPAYQWV